MVELRLAYPDAAQDRDRHNHRDSIVYLARPALLSDADIISARPSLAGSGELLLHLRFTPEAGLRLATTLQDHIGGYLAVVVEGRLRNVVVIASPVGSQNELNLNTSLTGPDAERVRELARTKWPLPRR